LCGQGACRPGAGLAHSRTKVQGVTGTSASRVVQSHHPTPDNARVRNTLFRHMTSPLTRLLALVITSASLLAPTARAQEEPQTSLPRVELSAGMHRIHAQVASTPQQRAIGLMHRREMPTNEGMLFVFEQPGTQCFWMKNTLLPLTAAFVADDGTVVNLADMQPQSLDSHCSTKPVRYVLEMHQGWFAKRGIQPGQRLRANFFEGQR